MVFYKYVSAKRVDILQKRLIRFTHPTAMNDPFEGKPDSVLLITSHWQEPLAR